MRGFAFPFPLEQGLHARPAARLADACRALPAAVLFRNERTGARADARSALGLLATATMPGDPCRLEGEETIPERDWQALETLVREDWPRDELPAPRPAGPAAARPLPPPLLRSGAAFLRGAPVAGGCALAPLRRLAGSFALPEYFACGENDGNREAAFFDHSCRRLREGILARAARAVPAEAGILRAHASILEDEAFRGRILSVIRAQGRPAGAVLQETAAALARGLEASPVPALRERAQDIAGLAESLGGELYGRPGHPAEHRLAEPGVLAADELSPSRLLALDRTQLRGLLLAGGSEVSHTAILARALGIPCVFRLGGELRALPAGAPVIADGDRGLVFPAPPAPVRAWYRLDAATAAERRVRDAALRGEPGRTADGVRIALEANAGSAEDAAAAWSQGAEGIGLFRTEFLFLGRAEPPSEEEQYRVYRQAVEGAGGRPVTLRTLDAGGDKPLPFLALPAEENPFLGQRAVRFYPAHAGLVKAQLRAMLRAAAHGPVRIMVPMVAALAEMRLVRELLAQAAAELGGEPSAWLGRVRLGAMVETPAAALAADSLGAEADFFSLGANDLLSYVMAADRAHPDLGALLDPRQPAFLRAVRLAVAGARAAGRPVGVCGEIAGDPRLLPLLAGAGVDSLSMAPDRLDAVRARLRTLSAADCRALFEDACACTEAADVEARLAAFVRSDRRLFPLEAGAVVLGAAVSSREEAVKLLCDRLALAGRAEGADELEAAVWEREETYATDMGLGFALPHAKTPAALCPSVAFARFAEPLDWTAGAEAPVRGAVLLALPAEDCREHLALMAALSRRLMDEAYRERLLGAAGVDEALDALAEGLGLPRP